MENSNRTGLMKKQAFWLENERKGIIESGVSLFALHLLHIVAHGKI
jgi:hypothetical protein